MDAKEIIISSSEKLAMDAQGRWTLIDTGFGLNEKITEAEAIDVLVRRASKNAALKPLIRVHFPMYNFHDTAPHDNTPRHKPDY